MPLLGRHQALKFSIVLQGFCKSSNHNLGTSCQYRILVHALRLAWILRYWWVVNKESKREWTKVNFWCQRELVLITIQLSPGSFALTCFSISTYQLQYMLAAHKQLASFSPNYTTMDRWLWVMQSVSTLLAQLGRFVGRGRRHAVNS